MFISLALLLVIMLMIFRLLIGAKTGQSFRKNSGHNYRNSQLAPQQVMLAPDAGAINNASNIPAANWQTINRCQLWGYTVNVLWWGQANKQKHLDIDELLVAGRWDEVRAIAPDEFFQLHPKATRKKLFSPKHFSRHSEAFKTFVLSEF